MTDKSFETGKGGSTLNSERRHVAAGPRRLHEPRPFRRYAPQGWWPDWWLAPRELFQNSRLSIDRCGAPKYEKQFVR